MGICSKCGAVFPDKNEHHCKGAPIEEIDVISKIKELEMKE